MNNLAIYIHWPFCKSKCPYCDFNSHVQTIIDNNAWVNAYLKQIESFRNIIKNKTITSIFFGGGTPSLMPPIMVNKIIDKLSSLSTFAPDIEITLEANPTSIESKKFIEFKTAGINRVSIGIQSFNENDLKFLGREHSKQEAISALEVANSVFDNYSFDLIYARPNQTIKMWEQELQQALLYAKNHLSLYQLTIEKGTPFYTQYKNNKFAIPKQGQAADLYLFTEQFMSLQGLLPYEISNYARPGFESQHNLAYWRYNEYLGIGPGAHSRILIENNLQAIVMYHTPQKWLDNVVGNQSTIQQKNILDKKDILLEYLIMGLRINEGIQLDRLEKLLKQPASQLLNIENIKNLCAQGYIIHNQNNLAVTSKGRLLLNHIIEQMIN